MSLLYDFGYAVRQLKGNPGLTIIIILSLSIGIGANAAVFSVVNTLLIRPLPYPDPDRLVNVWLRTPALEIAQDWPSPGQYLDVQAQNHVFQETAIAIGQSLILNGPTQPVRIEGMRASSRLLHMLGARAFLGRMLLPEEDNPGKPSTAVLTYGLWQRVFGSDPKIIGKSVVLNGNQATIVGVLAPDFTLTAEVIPTIGSIERMEIFVPLPLEADAPNHRGSNYELYNVVARLKPLITMRQAQADVEVIAGHIREFERRDPTFTMGIVSLPDQVVSNVRLGVLITMGAMALVLLVACANAASLLLSRAATREKEIAIRSALGGTKGRLARQLLTESTLLGLLGGATGLILANWSLHLVRAVNPGNIPRLELIGVDRYVLAFTFSVSLLTGLIFGVAPVRGAARVDLASVLRSGGRGSQGSSAYGRSQLRNMLVVAEVAISLMLLIGAGLLARSFAHLRAVSPGFNPGHVISMRIQIVPRGGYSGQGGVARFFREVAERIDQLPGIKSHGGISTLPFTSAISWGEIEVQGYTPPSGRPDLQSDIRFATPGYFETMEIPLLKGRFFSELDTIDKARPVALADEKMLKRLWPREDPIGKQVRFGPQQPWMTIVGVVGMVKQYGLATQGKMVMYVPSPFISYLVARTSSDPAGAADSIIQAIHAVDSDAVIFDVHTMESRMYDSLARQRFSTLMLGTFSVFALLLACIGIYGVMSYQVAQSISDFGVRIALGASRGSILRLVLGRGFRLATSGVAIGLIGALSMTRVMASLLFGVSPTDGSTFVGVAFLLSVTVLIASYVPARRAMKLRPTEALLHE